MKGDLERWVWVLCGGLAAAIGGCVSGDTRPPKCATAEEPVITSNVFDHSADKPAGDTWSCEASCPAGQTRVLAYADARPALRPGVFNGQWQKRYEYTCVPECGDGEKLERSVAGRSGEGTRYKYACYNVAERETEQAAETERKAAEAEDAAAASRENREAMRKLHPGAACMQDCSDLARECTTACQQRRCRSPADCIKTGGYPVCMQPCQEKTDACTAGCQGLPP